MTKKKSVPVLSPMQKDDVIDPRGLAIEKLLNSQEFVIGFSVKGERGGMHFISHASKQTMAKVALAILNRVSGEDEDLSLGDIAGIEIRTVLKKDEDDE